MTAAEVDIKGPARSSARRPQYARSVLVVDDDEDLSELVAVALETAGFNVERAASVAAARERLDEKPFSIALLDRELPDGSGHDVARVMRSRRLSTELVMMTAHGDLESAQEAIRLGFADYLEKPFPSPAVIVECAERVSTMHSLKWANRQLIEELRERNTELELLAARDPLTLLYNHAHFSQALEHEIARCRRHDLQFSMALIDLDHFKQINDTYGHLAGDRVLTGFAAVLRGEGAVADTGFRLREEDVAARYGGDEFALVLPGTTKRGAAQLVARLREVVASQVKVQSARPVTMSIGIASFPEDGATQATLFEAADVALYTAKNAGRDRWVAYNSSLSTLRDRQAASNATARRLHALQETIENRELGLVFQPIICSADGSISGYEALCRPRNPEFPNPYGLIKTAESAGRIDALGQILLDMSFEALPDIPDGRLLFVNLHPDQLLDDRLLETVARAAPHARRIVFEITEVAEIRDVNRVKEVMAELRRLGYRVALDDLGSGYSGLNSLVRFEPDYVKLDMQLVHAIDDPRTARLISYIMDFSEAEGITVVAEGIETHMQRLAMEELRCPLMQGYLFGRPALLQRTATGADELDFELEITEVI